MTTASDSPDANAAAEAGSGAQPSPYPTVQILQAAMAHRDSIRRSFESQRATLAEAIAAQKQAVSQAVVNTQRRPSVHEDDAAVPEAISLAASVDANIVAANVDGTIPADRVPIGANPTEKLVIALSLLTAPGSVATKNAFAQRAMATQQFLDALKALIAEEVSRQPATGANDSEVRDDANQVRRGLAVDSGTLGPSA